MPADFVNHFRRIPLVVALQDLENAAGILKRGVGDAAASHGGAFGLRLTGVAGALAGGRRIERVLIHPGIEIVLRLLRVPAAEQAIELFGVLKLIADDQRGVGIRDDVIVEIAVVREDVMDEAAEEGDISAGTNEARRYRRRRWCG